jgi:hypothetical protein
MQHSNSYCIRDTRKLAFVCRNWAKVLRWAHFFRPPITQDSRQESNDKFANDALTESKYTLRRMNGEVNLKDHNHDLYRTICFGRRPTD